MNSRESAALDRYITGNYGEDQFLDEDDIMHGHEASFYNHTIGDYEPTDDGPEADVIRIELINQLLDTGEEWLYKNLGGSRAQ